MGSADEFERMLQSHLACRNAPPSGQSWRLPLLSLPQSLTHREAQTRGRSGMRDIRDESPADRASKRCRHDGRAESQERSRRLDPRQLTAHLSHAPGLPELLSLQSKHGGDFDGVHVGAFWSRFKTLARDELVGLSERLAPVCQQTVRMLPELNARAVANIAHALSKGGLVGAGSWERVWAALPEVVCRSLGEFNSQALANTVWAFAKSRQASPELFDAISAEAMRRRLGGFTEQNLSITAWAFATAGHKSPELFNAISAEVVRRRFGGFTQQDMSNIAWAFAVLEPPSADELFGTATFTTRCAQFETSFSHEELAQLHQWSLWVDERGALWPRLPESLRKACRNAFVAEEGSPSQLQSDVVQEIRSRVAHVEEEHRCETTGYSIDAVVTFDNGDKVAVEVDGPSHFLGRSRQPTGATLLKQRQLRYFGWRLESVTYWEWERSKELHWLSKSCTW